MHVVFWHQSRHVPLIKEMVPGALRGARRTWSGCGYKRQEGQSPRLGGFILRSRCLRTGRDCLAFLLVGTWRSQWWGWTLSPDSLTDTDSSTLRSCHLAPSRCLIVEWKISWSTFSGKTSNEIVPALDLQKWWCDDYTFKWWSFGVISKKYAVAS